MNNGKLNELVAEHVFNRESFTVYPADSGPENSWVEWLLPGETRGITLPNYSTDITEALKIVDKLRENYRVFITADDEGYTVEIEVQKTSHSVAEYFEAEHDQLEVAICLAALKAEGVEIG